MLNSFANLKYLVLIIYVLFCVKVGVFKKLFVFICSVCCKIRKFDEL